MNPDIMSLLHSTDFHFSKIRPTLTNPEHEPQVGRKKDELTPDQISRIADETRRKIEEKKKKTKPPTRVVNPHARPSKTGPRLPDTSGSEAKDR